MTTNNDMVAAVLPDAQGDAITVADAAARVGLTLEATQKAIARLAFAGVAQRERNSWPPRYYRFAPPKAYVPVTTVQRTIATTPASVWDLGRRAIPTAREASE